MHADHLDLNCLEALLRTRQLGKAPGWANEVWTAIDSTNSRALELAQSGAPAGVIIAARQQTAGKGRLGRNWISPPDSGLYISFLLRPQVPIAQVPIMSLAAGVAAAKAIEQVCGFKIGLKWVNDITHHGKKLGGILAEMRGGSADRSNSSAATLVVGIGINLRMDRQSIPSDLQRSADWLENITSSYIDVNQLAATLALELENGYDLLCAGAVTTVLSNWKSYSVTLGKRVQANSTSPQPPNKRMNAHNQTIEGQALDIAEDGALILQLDSGEHVSVHAGDVSIRNVDGSYA